MSISRLLIGATCTILVTSLAITAPPARADDAGAFVGGMVAGRVLRNMNDRTEAEQQQAQAAQQQAQATQRAQAAPPPAQKSAQQRLQELDSLAAGGYITPEEYKAKKQQILSEM